MSTDTTILYSQARQYASTLPETEEELLKSLRCFSFLLEKKDQRTVLSAAKLALLLTTRLYGAQRPEYATKVFELLLDSPSSLITNPSTLEEHSLATTAWTIGLSCALASKAYTPLFSKCMDEFLDRCVSFVCEGLGSNSSFYGEYQRSCIRLGRSLFRQFPQLGSTEERLRNYRRVRSLAGVCAEFWTLMDTAVVHSALTGLLRTVYDEVTKRLQDYNVRCREELGPSLNLEKRKSLSHEDVQGVLLLDDPFAEFSCEAELVTAICTSIQECGLKISTSDRKMLKWIAFAIGLDHEQLPKVVRASLAEMCEVVPEIASFALAMKGVRSETLGELENAIFCIYEQGCEPSGSERKNIPFIVDVVFTQLHAEPTSYSLTAEHHSALVPLLVKWCNCQGAYSGALQLARAYVESLWTGCRKLGCDNVYWLLCVPQMILACERIGDVAGATLTVFSTLQTFSSSIGLYPSVSVELICMALTRNKLSPVRTLLSHWVRIGGSLSSVALPRTHKSWPLNPPENDADFLGVDMHPALSDVRRYSSVLRNLLSAAPRNSSLSHHLSQQLNGRRYAVLEDSRAREMQLRQDFSVDSVNHDLIPLRWLGGHGAVVELSLSCDKQLLIVSRSYLRKTFQNSSAIECRVQVGLPLIEDRYNILEVLLHRQRDIRKSANSHVKQTQSTRSDASKKERRSHKEQWWGERNKYDKEIRHIVDILDQIFGPWKVLLLGNVLDISAQQELDRLSHQVGQSLSAFVKSSSSTAHGRISSSCRENLPASDSDFGIDKELLYLLLAGLPYLSNSAVNTQWEENHPSELHRKPTAQYASAFGVGEEECIEQLTAAFQFLLPLGVRSYLGEAEWEVLRGIAAGATESTIEIFSCCLQGLGLNRREETADFFSLPRQHSFLVLDVPLHTLPFESLPVLQKQSVSRVPSFEFLKERLHQGESARFNRRGMRKSSVYYILNPEGDLPKTEARLLPLLQAHTEWKGTAGKDSAIPAVPKLLSHDLLLYFGHGAATRVIRPRDIRKASLHGTVCLMGCSSAVMEPEDTETFTGVPHEYLLAGANCFVGCLWDISDGEIDRFSVTFLERLTISLSQNNEERSVSISSPQSGEVSPEREAARFSRLSLQDSGVQDCEQTCHQETDSSRSVPEAVAVARAACKLRYLTGGAVVCYGIPSFFRQD